jgi:predicted TIM-barrel fold metal-dependent hydrolase
MNKSRLWLLAWIGIAWLSLPGCGASLPAIKTGTPAATPTSTGIQVVPQAEYFPDADCPARVRQMRAAGDASLALYERYRDLMVIDAHNHGAADSPLSVLKRQQKYYIDRTALFGNISEPNAIGSDQLAFIMYAQSPDRVYPFFAGIPLMEARGVDMTKENLEQGYFGIGEIVAASTFSPATSKLAWKADHPNAGALPEIYQLSVTYHVPVLLHIDPPDGEPIARLEQALTENPQASLIFGHANAYNPPEKIEPLLIRHPNLYIDFFAGFTSLNPDSTNSLADFVPLIEKYPDRFLVSTDSGYAVGERLAILAIYDLLDLLTPEAACAVSHQNFERLMETQLPTETQIAVIRELSRQAGQQGERRLNKRMANELIFELRKLVEGKP